MTENQSQPRIYIIEHRGVGGMIHYAYQMCTAMANHGADVTLVTAQEYELEHLPHNYTVIKLLDLWSRKEKPSTTYNSEVGRYLSKLSRFLRRLYRGYKFIAAWFVLVNYLVKQKPDIVQFGSMEFPFEALFLQYMRSRGLVITQICHEFEHRDRKIPSKLLRRLDWQGQANIFKKFDAIFFHAQNNLQRFKSLYPNTTENLFVIPMGNESLFTSHEDDDQAAVALAKKYGISSQGPNVLFFGTINPSKGLDDLISAFAAVHAARPDARLIIAGNPSKYVEMHDYLHLIRENDLEDVVVTDIRYIPNDEIAPLMKLSSVVAYPYHNSTQSASLQVAYSFGRPVIATNVGGLPEVVVDEKSGLLIPPKEIASLAAAILRILNEPEIAKQMGKFSKNLSETKFSWGPIAQKILGVYQNL